MRLFIALLDSCWGQRLLWLLPFLPLLWMTDLTAVLWIGLTILTLIFVKSARSATFQMVHQSIPFSLFIGTIVGCALSFLVDPWLIPHAEELTGTKMDLSQLEELPGNDGAYIEWLIVGIGFGGIWEEIAFRGFFIGWGVFLFSARWGIPFAVLISIVFGYGHIYQDLAGAVVTGVGSLVFGLTYVYCNHKLLPAIIAHSMSNFIGITQIYLYGI